MAKTPTLVTRIANLAEADVNVVQTAAKYNSALSAYYMDCTGCGEQGRQHTGTYRDDSTALGNAKRDAKRHAGGCSFQPPRR